MPGLQNPTQKRASGHLRGACRRRALPRAEVLCGANVHGLAFSVVSTTRAQVFSSLENIALCIMCVYVSCVYVWRVYSVHVYCVYVCTCVFVWFISCVLMCGVCICVLRACMWAYMCVVCLCVMCACV